MLLNASASEPLLCSVERRAGALLHRGPPVSDSDVLAQLNDILAEQASVTRQAQQLRNIVLNNLYLPSSSPGRLWHPVIKPSSSRGHPCFPLPLAQGRNLLSIPNLSSPFPFLPGISGLDGYQSPDLLRQKNRQLLESLHENERLRTTLDSAKRTAHGQSVYCAELQLERKLRTEAEENAAKAMEILVQQNLRLAETKDALEAQLKEAKADIESLKSKAKSVQDVQELAIAAFERCNALDIENTELKQAMEAFAEGSASATVQQLQKVVANLTEELLQYQKREGDLKDKENTIRDKEHHSIIRAMRKQTRELKVSVGRQGQERGKLTRGISDARCKRKAPT